MDFLEYRSHDATGLAKLVAEWLQVTSMERERALALVASDYAGSIDGAAKKAANASTVAAPARQVRHLAA